MFVYLEVEDGFLFSFKDFLSGVKNEFQVLGWGEVRVFGIKKLEFSLSGKLGKFD